MNRSTLVANDLRFLDLSQPDHGYFKLLKSFVNDLGKFDRILLGREGWLQKVRLNLIAYEDSLYLNLHGQ